MKTKKSNNANFAILCLKAEIRWRLFYGIYRKPVLEVLAEKLLAERPLTMISRKGSETSRYQIVFTDRSQDIRNQSLFMIRTGAEEIWEGVWKNTVSKEGL